MAKFLTEKNILWGMIFLYIIFFGIFTSLRHYNFQTQAWDMGIFTQTIWNTVNGRFMANSLEGIKLEVPIKNHFGVHMSPFLLLLAFPYFFIPSPYLLLIIQTIGMALGAWPLYLLAKRVLDGGWAILISAVYLFYPSLHWANAFDFHEITFFIPLFLAAVYFTEVKKWSWAILFLILAASTKEDAILATALFGLYLFLRAIKPPAGGIPKKWPLESKIGLALFLLSVLYFLLSTKIIMPAYGSSASRLGYRSAYLRTNAAEIIKNALNPLFVTQTLFTPQKLLYLLIIFSPLVFLPLFSWLGIFLLLPGLAENLLTNYPFQFSGLYHYDAILIPGVFIGAIYALKYWQRKWPKISKIKYLIILAAALNFLIRSPLSPFLFPTELFRDNPHWEALRKMTRLVPSDVSVTAPANLIPHLTNREQIYVLGTEPFQTDIVLIDGGDLSGFGNEAVFQNYADSYALSGNYDINSFNDRYFIFSKKGIQLAGD